MPDYSELSTEELEEAIKARQKYLEETCALVRSITRQLGERTHYDQGNSNTHEIWELRDFEGFSFRASTGESMMGGEGYKIWYHPHSSFQDNRSMEVFDVHFQASVLDNHARIQVDQDRDWQRAYQQVIQRKNEIIAERKRAKQKAAEEARSERAQQDRRAELERQAAHLKI